MKYQSTRIAPSLVFRGVMGIDFVFSSSCCCSISKRCWATEIVSWLTLLDRVSAAGLVDTEALVSDWLLSLSSVEDERVLEDLLPSNAEGDVVPFDSSFRSLVHGSGSSKFGCCCCGNWKFASSSLIAGPSDEGFALHACECQT